MRSGKISGKEAEIRIWDPFVRVFHWLLVVGFFVAFFSDGDWMDLHIWSGYLVCLLIALRILWGFAGTAHARFRDFVYPPGIVFGYLKQVLTLRAERYVGHNPAGGAMIILLLVFVLITTVSGMMLYGADAWLGPLAGLMKNVSESTTHQLEEVHEFFANGTVLLVIFHVVGVIWESVLHRENLVKSMITGRKKSNNTGSDL